MLDHLINYDPPPAYLDAVQPLDAASAQDVVDAQYSTAQWLKEMGAPTADTVEAETAQAQARAAFTTLATVPDEPKQKGALLRVKTPAAVQHLVGMLTAYDWEFVNQAKEIRGYAVAQIVEETKHPDARIRLRALELLGRVTEVALFTDRMEVKKTEMADHELEAKIKEKLARFLPVEDASIVDIDAKPAPNSEISE